MSMYDTVVIDDDAPIDNRICHRDWQTHEEGVGAKFRVNSDGELEKQGIKIKEGVEEDDYDEFPLPNQLEYTWIHLDDYNGPFYLNGMHYKATLMVWDGIVKETKFEKINYDSIRENMETAH